ncbi:MAG: hypothetical protein ABR577_19680, partial [Pyrinomonadaceae bacterium]
LKTQRELNPNKQDDVHPPKLKTLREVGKERNVEVPLPDLELNNEYRTLDSLIKSSQVVVVGRVTSEDASFKGDNHIITTYALDIQRVLRDTTSAMPALQNIASPAPVTSPFTFYRDGGEVKVNGHQVSEKLKGSELLTPGNDYVLFLTWSPNFGAYRLVAGASGAFLIKNNLRIHPLGSKPELKLKHDDTDLDTFIGEVLKVNS